MTLNEDDKKFIKNTVDSSVQKNMTELQKNNDAFKKSLSNSAKQRTKRDQYIEELKALRQNDQATMAQRFELFQVETKKSLKEGISSVTHTVKDAAGTMGQGASRVGSGVDKIVTGIMNLNPITAMLWKNKGIVGDIVGGSLQMGTGAIKGAWGLGKTVAGGAGSLMKNAVDASLHLAFGRKKKRKESEEENPETPVGKLLSSITRESEEEDTSLLPEDEEYGAESLSKINKEMQKQIEEIHQIVVKDKEKQTKELTGGMGRIYKVMEAVNGVIKMIQDKQKLIITGVLLGAAAIVGLAAWFKNGGLANLFKKPIDDSFNNRLNSTEKAFKADSDASALSYMTGATQQKLFNKKPEMLTGISGVKKKQNNNPNTGETKTVMSYETGELTPVLAPYDGWVDKLNKLTAISNGEAKEVKWVMKIRPKDEFKLPPITLRGLISPQVQPKDKFKKGDMLAYASKEFSMENEFSGDASKVEGALSGYSEMVNKAKETGFSNNLQRLAETKTQDKTEKLKDFLFHKDDASYNRQKHDDQNMADGSIRIHDFFHNKKNDITRTTWDAQANESVNRFLEAYNQQPVPNPVEGDEFGSVPDIQEGNKEKGTMTGPAASIQSENAIKTQKQNEQLKQSTQPQPTPPPKTNQSGYVGQSPKLGTNVTATPPSTGGDIYSDKMPWAWLDKAVPNSYGMDY